MEWRDKLAGAEGTVQYDQTTQPTHRHAPADQMRLLFQRSPMGKGLSWTPPATPGRRDGRTTANRSETAAGGGGGPPLRAADYSGGVKKNTKALLRDTYYGVLGLVPPQVLHCLKKNLWSHPHPHSVYQAPSQQNLQSNHRCPLEGESISFCCFSTIYAAFLPWFVTDGQGIK